MERTSLPAELPDELATLWYLIRRVASVMDRQGEALFRRELGVSLAQFLVLSVVDAHPGPLSQQAVADRVGLTKGSVSRQIDSAVAAGLMTVRVATHTRRENAVALTEAGTALVRRGDALLHPSRAAMLDAINPREIPAALHVLSSLLGALER
ncbi:MAG TPA: MarR family winged helix-turn-helix transcriptional regulator [Streptosporangiaceae bacterium]|nr:MarR family winged helix-turn-helix transcriptional regulator [Streptosporangiaceae bacterium]